VTAQTLDPNADRSGAGDFTITGSASTIALALSDASDTTFVKRTSGTVTKSFVLDMDTYVLGVDEAVESVQVNVRMARPETASRVFVRQGVVTDAAAGVIRFGAPDQYSGSVALSTLEGAPRINAPDGLPWDQTRLNNLVIQVTDYASASTAVSAVYELEAVATINERPSASVTSPSGTVADTSRPAVSWTYTDADDDPQSVYEVKVFTAAQYGAAGFDPDSSAGEWESGLVTSSDTGVTVPVDLETGTTYRAYVRVGHTLGSSNFISNWAFSQFVMDYAAPPSPQLDVSFSPTFNVVYITATGRTNYLSDDDSVFTASIGSWQSVTGVNLTRETGTFQQGVASLGLTSTAGTTMRARTGLYAVATDGQNVSGIADFRADAVGRSCRTSLYWYDASASLISVTDGIQVSDVSTGWVTASVTGVPPSGAASAALGVEVASPVSAEVHYVDKAALHPGPVPTWGPGGLYENQSILVQRSNDNGVTWEDVSQFDASIPTQVAQSDDYEALRGQTNVYRARTIGVTGSLDVLSSAFSSDAAAFVTNDGKWWLKALGSKRPDCPCPALNIGGVTVRGPVQSNVQQSVGVFRPLGRNSSVVVSGDIYGSDGDYVLLFTTEAEWQAAQGILFSHTGDVAVQDPFNGQKRVRFVSRSVEHIGTVGRPVRAVTVGYVEVG
jgi:hypothetical protein